MKQISHKNNRNKSITLTRLQQSILRQYKRLSFGEQTPKYDYDSIYYSEIPYEIPSAIRQNYNRCLILYNYSLFEMISFALFQYYFVNQTQVKMQLLNRLKQLICSDDFMYGSHYIKGLLIKGLRLLKENAQNLNQNSPVAQALLKSECMQAYSECWKQIVDLENDISEVQEFDESQPNNYVFSVLSNYLGVNFKIYWKRGIDFEEEYIRPEQPVVEEYITFVATSNNLVDSIVNKISQNNNRKNHQSIEDISSIQGSWGYIILLQKPKEEYKLTKKLSQVRSKQKFQSFDVYKKINESKNYKKGKEEINLGKQIKGILEASKVTINSGILLLESFKQFLQQMEEQEMNILI